jgi:hypothetical protein
MGDREFSPGKNGLDNPTRRRILAASVGTLATGLAGCIGTLMEDSAPTPTETSNPTATNTPVSTAGSSTLHEQAKNPFRELRQTENTTTTALSFEVVLEAGQYAHRELRIEEPSDIRIVGETTAPMDVFLLTPESAFSKYQEGERAILSGGMTKSNINSIDETVGVSSGRYFLIFDNTAVYGGDPQGELNSRFEITIASGHSTPSKTESKTPADTESEPPTETEPPSQPKIREVTDNFGHTFEFSSDTGGSFHVDDEIVVNDDTTVELCVTDVAKRDDHTVTYSYDFLKDARHPDNPERASDRIESNCWNWDMRRTDFQSYWGFRIWLRNDDEIYYQNNSVESDYRVDVYYDNLTLEDK